MGAHLADQLLLLMALAGRGPFSCVVDHRPHTANMALIEQFLPVKFSVEEVGSGIKEVLCK